MWKVVELVVMAHSLDLFDFLCKTFVGKIEQRTPLGFFAPSQDSSDPQDDDLHF